MKLQFFSLHNYKNISQINKLYHAQLEAIEVVGNVLPIFNEHINDDVINRFE